MCPDPREGREYEISVLPVLRDNAPKIAADDIRLALYGRICENWRALVDVRFKLLALVPIVSGFGVSKVLEPSSGPSPTARTGLAVVGLAATAGLLIYDVRNTRLHNELINRAARIEDELGVDTGQFRGRPNPSNRLVTHRVATAIIYGASLLAWVFAMVMVWVAK